MLLLSEAKTRANIQRMADRARRHGLDFRPHAKTHQSRQVTEWLVESGVREISVTHWGMMRKLFPTGVERVTIAMPFDPSMQSVNDVNELSEEINTTVLVTNPITARAVAEHGYRFLDAYIEIDAGYGRSGVPFREEQSITELINILGPDRFRGFYVHSGHTYDAGGPEEIAKVHQELLAAVATVRSYPATPPGCEFTIGDTPACSTQEDFTGITAIGPGNFVYYDLVQAGLGACTTEDIAVCYAAPVLEVRPERGDALLHAGWVQLGKDQLPDGTYGRPVRLTDDGWGPIVPGATMTKLSQEHGTATLPAEWLAELRPGDRIGILPVHACAAVHGALATGQQRFV